ncbi:MAG: hypothetical protein GY765_05615 [bacterium]|nr:hypothetical protein [bacterium]
MSHTYAELKKKTVNELRKIASGIEHDAVQGYTQLNKEHLLVSLCNALGLDTFEHHKAVGINKTKIKKQIKALKKKRDDLLATKDRKELKGILDRIHSFKRKLHKATV